jgi:hypothetical protein
MIFKVLKESKCKYRYTGPIYIDSGLVSLDSMLYTTADSIKEANINFIGQIRAKYKTKHVHIEPTYIELVDNNCNKDNKNNGSKGKTKDVDGQITFDI